LLVVTLSQPLKMVEVATWVGWLILIPVQVLVLRWDVQIMRSRHEGKGTWHRCVVGKASRTSGRVIEWYGVDIVDRWKRVGWLCWRGWQRNMGMPMWISQERQEGIIESIAELCGLAKIEGAVVGRLCRSLYMRSTHGSRGGRREA
jgi:hypothetical protein